MLPYDEAIDELIKAPNWSKKSREAIHTAIAVLTIAKMKERREDMWKSQYQKDKESEAEGDE
jgi:hypothetical protein